MAPPDTPKRRGRKRSKRRTASTGPRHASLSEEPRPSTLPGSPAFTGKKKRGGRGRGGTAAGTQPNCTSESMPQEDKLDNLCHLLEDIIMQHGTNEVNAAPQLSVKSKGAAASGASAGDGGAAGPSTSGQGSEAKAEPSREEVERERKARKEAKKAKKKAPGKENVEIPNSRQPAQQNNAASTPSVGTTGKAPATPVKQKTAVANSVPVAAVGPSGESSSQPSASGANQGEDSAAAGKSKAELRKERREKQEAQRQAKLAAKAQQEEERKAKEKQAAEKPKVPGKVKAAGEGTRKRPKKAGGKGERNVPLLGHLPPHSPNPPEHYVNSECIHPAILSVGLKMKYGVVKGATARVISMLSALKQFVSDYRTPEACDLSRDMADKLQPNVDFLAACRPHAVAMDNAIRSVKHKINSIDPATPEAQAKDELRATIDEFVEVNINLASSTIATHATSLIHDDVLLTFGYSALVCDVVEAVVKAGGQVSVVVADYPHPPSGAAMVQHLSQLGVPTYYRLITDLSHIMSKVTKVVVEAEAVMMNGAVQAMCGTASLALAAATHHKPFIVLCQTYKFCNIDLTDSLVMNELSDPDSVATYVSDEQRGVLADWRETQNLNVVHLVYDVTPASLVTVLVTEQSVLPTSAVPVIIHRKYADIMG